MMDVQGSFYVIDFGKAKREEVGEASRGPQKIGYSHSGFWIRLIF